QTVISQIIDTVKALQETAEKGRMDGYNNRGKARQVISDLDEKGTLEIRPLAEKTKLLAGLLGCTEEPLDNNDLKLLRKLYLNLPLDEKFVAEDNKRREKIVEALVGGDLKEELKTARDRWGKMDGEKMEDEDKRKLLAEISKRQCAALKIPEIPNGVILVEKKPENGGAFDVHERQIQINKNNDNFKYQFAAAIDTVLHETSHWWQSCMIDEFYKGNIQNTHPDYAQIQLFALNDNRNRTDAYVKSGEA